MRQKKQSSVKIWDYVWEKDTYSDPELRKIKAKQKVELLLKWLPVPLDKNSIIIDAGCGGGYISEYLAERTGSRVEGFDQSSKAIDVCKKRKGLLRLHFECCDVSKLPYASQYADVIVCVGMIEHNKNYEACIKELKRVLKKNGYLYIVSSNKYSVMWLQWIWKNILHSWNYGYQKNWTPRKLNQYLCEQSFETVQLEVIEGMGNFNRLTRIDHFLRRWNRWIGRYIVYLGKKRM